MRRYLHTLMGVCRKEVMEIFSGARIFNDVGFLTGFFLFGSCVIAVIHSRSQQKAAAQAQNVNPPSAIPLEGEEKEVTSLVSIPN